MRRRCAPNSTRHPAVTASGFDRGDGVAPFSAAPRLDVKCFTRRRTRVAVRAAKAIDEPGADDLDDDVGAGAAPKERPSQKRGGRQPLARHLKRERIVHDLTEAEKHCAGCGKDLRLIAEETSERYEYIPASMKVVQDVCLKYACDCTVRTATKPAQPIEKSTAGASLLAQVIVAKWADHQPLHRQEKMFERHGIDISRKTMGGWMARCAELLDPLYQLMKKQMLS